MNKLAKLNHQLKPNFCFAAVTDSVEKWKCKKRKKKKSEWLRKWGFQVIEFLSLIQIR